MKLADLDTVATLARRLRDIDGDLQAINNAREQTGKVKIQLHTSHWHEIEADVLLPYLRATRTEIILDLASYGVSVP